jgi:hypothetical protein
MKRSHFTLRTLAIVITLICTFLGAWEAVVKYRPILVMMGTFACGATAGAVIGRRRRDYITFGDIYLGGVLAIAVLFVSLLSWLLVFFTYLVKPGAF